MKTTIFSLKARLKYHLTAHYWKGHRVHSPFTYHTLNNVIFERTPYYSFKIIEPLRKSTSRTQTRCDQLLQRLCASNNAKTIVQIGSANAIDTLYLASNDSESKVYIYISDTIKIQELLHNANTINEKNISIITDHPFEHNINQHQQIDIIHITNPHDTTITFTSAKDRITPNTIIIVNTPHKTPEAERQWQQIIADNNVRLSIDLFHMGIMWFNTDIPKQHYTAAF